MLQRRRRNDQVGLGKCTTSFTTVLQEHSPPEHDLLSDRKNPTGEHGSDSARKPLLQIGAAHGISGYFNAKADFGQGHRAYVQFIERARVHEADNPVTRVRTFQFRKNIRVEKPSRQNSTSRTGMWGR